MRRGLQRPSVADWTEVNRQVPRLVDALPNGPRNFATVQVFLAGGVPEVMLHLRAAGLARYQRQDRHRRIAGACLDWWKESERRQNCAACLRERDGIDADDVIMSPDARARKGLTFDHLFSRGQSCARGLGHQEHGNRPVAGGRERRLSPRGSGQSFYHGGGGDSGHQERRRSRKAM